ncbi:MAG: MFS transporter [Acidimicrobiales bacterium]
MALAVAATAMLLAAFVGTATNIAVPILEEDFPGAGLTTVSWVVSAFNVAQVTFMLIGGRLADRVGRRRIFLLGLGVFGLGAAASGVAPTIGIVIAARFVQAVGVALMLPSSLAAVLPEFPPERHGSVVSLWSSMGVLGAAVAPTVAAGLLQVASWRLVFLSVLPVVIVAAVVGRSVLAPGRPAEDPAPLDLVGAAAGTLAVGGSTFAVVQGRAWGLTDPRIVVVAVMAALAAVVLVRSSRTHPEPLVDLGLLRIPTFTVVTTAGGLLSASTSATWFLYPLFMMEVWGYSVLDVGLAMTPGPVTLVILAPIAGRLVDRHGYRAFLIAGAVLATAGTAWMAWRLRPDETYLRAFLPGTISIGVGMAFMLGPANAAALRDVPASQLGAANAAYNMTRMAGAAFGVAMTAAIIGDTAAGDRLDAFRASWIAVSCVMALAPLLLWRRFPDDRPGRVGGRLAQVDIL